MKRENRCVLLVDDDENILAALERRYGRTFHLTTATSGAAGLAALKADGPFAVVVSDLKMPGMDGLAFLEQVREYDPDCRRIMLTGDEDLEIGVAAIDSGLVSTYLCKPCTDHGFEDAVNLAIAEHAARAAVAAAGDAD